MSMRLPLFPLGSVLFPGLVLPLHIFEPRYRQLVADLLAGSEPRQFGVIAIRRGRETGVDGVSALYETGCTAVLRQVEPLDDGGFDLVAVGAQRFQLGELAVPSPYLSGVVELLPDEVGDSAEAALAARSVQRQFRDCRTSRSCSRTWSRPPWSWTSRTSSGCWKSRMHTVGWRPSGPCWPARSG
jgi:uncharacterized protein